MPKHLHLDRDALAAFCKQHKIAKLSLFGSVLRDDFGTDSDVDVLVEFEPGVKVGLSFFSIQSRLSQLLGRNVDLNTPGFISKYFRDEVIAEAEVQYVAA